MKGQKKEELGYYVIFEILSLLQDYAPIMERDEVLYNSFKSAYARISEIVTAGVRGDIVEEYVVTEYEFNE